MKKVLSLMLAMLLALSLTACGNAGSTNSDKVEGEVSALLDTVTNGITSPELALRNTEVTDETFEWYFFIPAVSGAEAIVSEPEIGSIAHCIGLVRVPEETDAETVRKDIETNLNPHKWICVEAEKTAVIRRGDLILLAMGETAVVDAAVANFNNL